MKLWILSDLHREFEHFRVDIPRPFPEHDAVILAGDIDQPPAYAMRWIRETFGDAPVVYVAGNHEFYGGIVEEDLRDARKAAAGHGIHFLENGEAVIAGTRFLGCTLWTDFALFGTPDVSRTDARHGMNDFSQIAFRRERSSAKAGAADEEITGMTFMPTRFTTAHALRMHRESRAWLEKRLAESFEGPTVVVTHHAPHRNSVAERFSQDRVTPGFVSHMPEIFRHRIDLWVHGHTHDGFDYTVEGTRVVANPKGYGNENTLFDWRKVIELPDPVPASIRETTKDDDGISLD